MGCRLVVGEIVLFILFDGVYWLVFLVFVVVELVVVLYLRGRLEAVVGVVVMVLILMCEFLSWLVIVVCLEVALLEERLM